MKCHNCYFRCKCEKVILPSQGRLRPSEASVKRLHEDKITFLLVYRTQFFHTMCTELDLTHAFLFEHAKVSTQRTECEKIMLDSCDKYDSGSNVIVTLAWLERQTHTRARTIFIKYIGEYYIILYIWERPAETGHRARAVPFSRKRRSV